MTVMDRSFTAGSNAVVKKNLYEMESVRYVRSPFLVGEEMN